ncbi:LamG-like jellyroll fold domain-containing protein [Candidatus Poribacteria bacterium]
MKVTIIWIGLMMLFLFFVSASYAKIDMATVAGLWLFDEGEGDIVEDLSGNVNHGKLINDPEWVKGVFGKALKFNGTNYVSVPDSDSLDMEEQVTVMFWVRSDKKMVNMWIDRQAVVGKHFEEYEVGIYMAGQLHTYTSDGAGGTDEGIMTSIAGKLPDKDADWEVDKWYHVAWTLEGNHEIAYVNGIKLGEHNKPHVNTQPGTNPLVVAHRIGDFIKLTGAVDEVIALNMALEIDDIELVFREGLEVALNILAVDATGKLATTWAAVRYK